MHFYDLAVFFKLLLIFVLGVHSAFDTPATDEIYYYSGVLDAKGVVPIDYQEAFDIQQSYAASWSKKIESLAILVNGTTHTSTKFLPVAETESIFNTLKTTLKLTQEENDCEPVSGNTEDVQYNFYGYTVKAVTGADIYPSITQLIKGGPQIVRNVNINPDDPEDYFVDEIEQSCNRQYDKNLLQYSLHKNGVVNKSCIPNTAIPQDASKCVDANVVYKSYLKGFKEGYFYDIDTVTLKKLLIRTGVVKLDVNSELIIGWQGSDWIKAIPDSYGYCTWRKEEVDYEYETYTGTVLFNLENYPVDAIDEEEEVIIDDGGYHEVVDELDSGEKIDEIVKSVGDWFEKNWKLIVIIVAGVVGGYIVIASIVTTIFCLYKHKQNRKGKNEQEIPLKQPSMQDADLLSDTPR